ncbi:hypothetical protein HNQ57_003021 [Zhongshania antarctica]|uniref:Uncharacterized protein n=1 Tax=Zhongshania antarctica TaxID=641702 RepID=A0A840R8P7_9GAMM|nr:hypothetical protein [Zhongshania antarctica]MBB5188730.1 hypothetical protein [Zhongshania antarctica]
MNKNTSKPLKKIAPLTPSPASHSKHQEQACHVRAVLAQFADAAHGSDKTVREERGDE